MSFGKRLKVARKEKKLTQEYVANLLGIDDTTISKYENDKSELDNETLNRLCELYGINTHWVHTGEELDKSLLTDDTFDVLRIFELVDTYSDDEIMDKFLHSGDKKISPDKVRALLSYTRFLKNQN